MTALSQSPRFWMIRYKPDPHQRYSTRAEAFFYGQHLADFFDAPIFILEAVEIIRPGTNQKGLDL